MGLHDKPVEDVPGAPPELMAALRRSLAADPAVRPQSAAELRDALADLTAPRSGPPTQTVMSAAPQAQSHPTSVLTQDAWPAAAGRHAKGSLSPRTPVPAGVAVSPGAPTGSFPDSASTKSLPVGSAARRRRPRMRLVALATGLIVIIGAAAIIGVHRALGHGAQAATPVSRVLYSFKDGQPDGWLPGANLAGVAAVKSFLNGPKHPHDGPYALDASPTDNGAPASATWTMMVTPVTPLNLAAARIFYLYMDCYGFVDGDVVATGYEATVTLTDDSHRLTTVVPILANTWNPVDVDVSSWPYRDHVTGISVSFAALGSNISNIIWTPHFQIDDVGYKT
jgi:hypothetical protein